MILNVFQPIELMPFSFCYFALLLNFTTVFLYSFKMKFRIKTYKNCSIVIINQVLSPMCIITVVFMHNIGDEKLLTIFFLIFLLQHLFLITFWNFFSIFLS